MDKDLYDLPPEELKKIPTVCGSLREALANLDKDRAFLKAGGVFNDDFIDSYIELKMQEVMRFEMTPHPVEFDDVLLLLSARRLRPARLTVSGRAPQGALLFWTRGCSQKKDALGASFDHFGERLRPPTRTGCRRPDRWRGVRRPLLPEPAYDDPSATSGRIPRRSCRRRTPARRHSPNRHPSRRRPGGHPAA